MQDPKAFRDEIFPKYREDRPDRDQTREQIEAHYRKAKVGDPVVVLETQFHSLNFYVTTIERIHRGRVYPVGHGSFFIKSNAYCEQPHGQCSIVIPTEEVLAYAKTHPPGPGAAWSARFIPLEYTNSVERQKKGG